MLTNPNWNVHKDYIVTDVFKPAAANQLVGTIPYDYVITQEMLDWGNTNAKDANNWIDIAKVLKHGDTGSTTGMTAKSSITLMVDADTTPSTKLDFSALINSPWFTSEAYTNNLHIYTRGHFTYKGRNGVTYIHNGCNNRAYLVADSSTGYLLQVGVFHCDTDITWNGTLVYEDSSGTKTPDGTLIRAPWMTNKVPITTSDITDISSITPESFVLHTGNIYPPEVDNTSFTAAQEILGKNLLPYLVLSHDNGCGYFLPLVRIEQGCNLVFRLENRKQDYRLVQGTGSYNADTNPNGNNIPVGSRGWLIVNDPVVPEVIDFPGASIVQADVYAMLKRNLFQHGLPKLRYHPSGNQCYLISYAHYVEFSSNEYYFYWAYTSGGTTTTLWMNDTGEWAIS